MYILLIAIFVTFVVAMSSLVGQWVYHHALTVSWMKNEKLFGVVCGVAFGALLIEYGWPIYQVLVIKKFVL